MKLHNPFRKFSKRGKVVATSLVLAAIVGLPVAVHAGFFPGRATFDYNKFDANNLNCDDPNNIAAQGGRCGSMNGPVFNSFINTPSYGDERQFTDGRRTDQPASATSDTIANVTDGSKQVLIRMYVHNNANQNTNASGKGIAHNAKVSLELPTNSGSALQAVGAISASNATPGEVTDTVFMTAGRAFHVKYVAGSAKLLRGTSSFALSDSIVSGGAPIGDQVMDGNLPGCFDFAALVEVKVDIIPEASTNLQLVKQVANVGDNTGYHKEVTSKPGQEEQWLLTTKNIGLDPLTNVQVRDILPPHLAFVPGSVKLVNVDQTSFPQADAPLFGNGVGLGTYPSGAGRYVVFKTKALDDFTGCSVRVRNIAKAKSTQTPTEVQDTADVVIQKENCNVQPPAFTCDALDVTKISRTSFKFTGHATATNATITGYVFSVNGAQAQDSASNVFTFNQETPGDYTVSLIVKTDKGNTAPTPVCTKKVTVEKQPNNPVFKCEMLTAVKGDNRTVTFTTTATADGGATITVYHYTFGDGTPELVTDKATVTHQYAKDGQFAAKVRVQVAVNGETQFADSANCATAVTFTTPPNTPPVTPVSTTPTTLVNTGPGSIAAIFAVVTTLGAIAHRWYLGRRLSA